MPATSVMMISSSARSAPAIAAAAISALTLSPIVVSTSFATGEMTGVTPFSSRTSIAAGSTFTTSPTSPRSAFSPLTNLLCLRAKIVPEWRPDIASEVTPDPVNVVATAGPT